MVLSDEEERRSLGAVEGVDASELSGPSIEGEKDTLYTGAECPMRRRELDGGSFTLDGTTDGRASPCKFQTRIYDSSVPTATRFVSSENSMQVILHSSKCV